MAGWRVLAVVVATTLAVSAMDATTLRASRVAPVGRADEHYRLSQPGPTDSAEVEKFLDELFASQLDEGHIAGAAVAVVKDGRILFSKGYGLADVENGVPVDPESTLFRIGSISKLFTWTAVMQLVEQGKLDLDADVNTYLDFRVPDTFSEPITLRHLLTHTSGFEDRLLGSVTADPNELIPAREGILALMPTRIRPPGEAAGYANFNAILAGYIVARASGQPFEEYVQDHILRPLGMAHSSARSSPPEELAATESIGYSEVEGSLQEYPYYLLQPAGLPSGAIRASANDMARFMIALLQGGGIDALQESAGASGASKARVLQESTAGQMLETQYTPDSRLRGMGFGFADMSDNGQRALGHQGYYPPMHSQLLLLPDQNVGLFVSYNSMGADPLTAQHAGFQRAFFDHYYPAAQAGAMERPTDFAERAGRFVGEYRFASAPATTLIKIVELFGAYRAAVTDPGDGSLVLNLGGQNRQFVEVEPLYFRDLTGQFGLVFQEDGAGRITGAYTDLMPQYGLIKLAWYESSRFNMALLLLCTLVFLSIVPIALVRGFRGRAKSGADVGAGGARRAYRLLVVVCLLNVAFVVGTAMWGNPPTELGSLTLRGKVVLGVGLAGAVLTIGAVAYSVLAWLRRYWGVAFRVYYTVVSVAAVAFVWFLDYWNLLGWRY